MKALPSGLLSASEEWNYVLFSCSEKCEKGTVQLNHISPSTYEAQCCNLFLFSFHLFAIIHQWQLHKTVLNFSTDKQSKAFSGNKISLKIKGDYATESPWLLWFLLQWLFILSLESRSAVQKETPKCPE